MDEGTLRSPNYRISEFSERFKSIKENDQSSFQNDLESEHSNANLKLRYSNAVSSSTF